VRAAATPAHPTVHVPAFPIHPVASLAPALAQLGIVLSQDTGAVVAAAGHLLLMPIKPSN